MTTLITKNSSTASAVPTTSDLVQGELAVNVTDKRAFTKNAAGTVVELGTNPSSLTLSGGTANGVAYLNGSKVLTTGSSLTFDGTNLGIGTNSPIAVTGPTLDIAGASGASQRWRNNAGTSSAYLETTSGITNFGTVSSTPLAFMVGAGEQMRLTSTGLGIGTTSPSYRIHAVGSGLDKAEIQSQNTGTATDSRGTVRVKSAASTYGGGLMMTYSSDTAYPTSSLCLYNYDNQPLVFGTNNLERARIDSSGNLLVGTTTAPDTGCRAVFQHGGNFCSVYRVTSTGTSYMLGFYNSNGLVGRIETSGSTTSYVTSSDYRLKENIAPMTGALDKVAALKPCTYTWKSDGSDGQGFIAHELQAVVPDCVTGEKDAVDEDGNPKYQGIDTSFLVATLTAAIQEQQAIIESLKARLDAANL